MKPLKIIKGILTLKPITNQILFLGCRLGSPKLSKLALFLGADVNAKKWMGHYSDGVGGMHNDYWTGSIYVAPIVVAATRAFGKTDDSSYRQVIKLLSGKGADTSKVVVGTQKNWFTDDDYYLGVSPDEISSYYRTLSEVAKERTSKKRRFFYYNSPSESYPITDSMALYLHQFVRDDLTEKADFIQQQSTTKRLIRKYYSEYMPAANVIVWRRDEELSRLAARRKWEEKLYNER